MDRGRRRGMREEKGDVGGRMKDEKKGGGREGGRGRGKAGRRKERRRVRGGGRSRHHLI